MTTVGHNCDDNHCKSDKDNDSGSVSVSDVGGKSEMRSEMDGNSSASISSSSCYSGDRNGHEIVNEVRMDTDGDLEEEEEEEEECLDGNSDVGDKDGLRPPRPSDFQLGDHVYQWCSLLGIPAVFAHHGIVLDVAFQEQTQKWSLLIVDFDNWYDADDNDDDDERGSSSSSSSSSSPSKNSMRNRSNILRSFSSVNDKHREVWDFDGDKGHLRVRWSDSQDWKKVSYGVGFWKQSLSRGGTVTKAKSDPPDMVLARVRFLLDHPHLLPPYDVIQSNCECAATWCKTGTWMTLQAAQFLHSVVAGHLKSTATVAGAIAKTQVTVPSAGLWGWLGCTTQVSLISTQPWIVPALVVGGAVVVGAPAAWLAVTKKHWKKMTEDLNGAFYNNSATFRLYSMT
eukprot:CAMPEP_0113463918 /NCGR_PEP_ID=MMETSP0014_2-20120614/12919_1 /TAXON_ID=2857 /ORGANISM="Nitzschia sp." /LENGTH=396 /DNA_ID=CAMNT_0000355955 /DNA_START=19 /DNA_END=1209 /DNA_ORIENTATION=- /assembly_acc=CAM_ASM_000159